MTEPEDLLAQALRAKAVQDSGSMPSGLGSAETAEVSDGSGGLAPGWILVVAALLGLAAGAVIGLLTLL